MPNAAPETPETTAIPTCPKCQGAMWDNRLDKKNPRAPDFKCRDRDCDGVIWPPRDPSAPAPAAQDPNVIVPPKDGEPACPTCGNAMWDNRVNKKNPKAPDYKCKRGPKWPATDGCEGLIWPPRDGESTPAAGKAGAKKAAPARAAAAPVAAAYDLTAGDADDAEDGDDLPF
jgi:hypothetical protein